MTELWLVRHGQTDWNLEGRYQGHADIPLNATGMEQAYILAEKLDHQPFDAIFCSDLQRAKQTAQVLAEKTGLEVHVDARLREICQGEWEGKKLDEIKKSYNKSPGERSDPLEARAPGGESAMEVATRVRASIEDIVRLYPEGKILIVSHGFALATLICQARHYPLEDAYDHVPGNATPEVIQWS